MAELVFRTLGKITHADWLLNGQRFDDTGPTGPTRFLFHTGKFKRENIRADFCESLRIMKYVY